MTPLNLKFKLELRRHYHGEYKIVVTDDTGYEKDLHTGIYSYMGASMMLIAVKNAIANKNVFVPDTQLSHGMETVTIVFSLSPEFNDNLNYVWR